MYRVWSFVASYSLLLIAGAALALIWANLAPGSYHDFIEYPIVTDFFIGAAELHDGDVVRVVTPHFLINELLMAFFFFIAGKEVWEAVILKNGSLRGKKAATPLIATAGGMIGPISVYLGLAAVMGSDMFSAVADGWAIPTATDIAFSYLVGRIVFGAGHPAVRFLLLLAIADDAAGLIILAVFYPSGEVVPAWLLLSLAASVGAFVLFNWLPLKLDRGRETKPVSTWVRDTLSYWPYFIAGAIGWYGFMRAGLEPALGLLPIIPAIPHQDRAFGIFAEAERYLTDVLNRMEHILKNPVEVILFLFGLANAGVALSSIGAPTWLVLAGLLIGKPVGIFLFGIIADGPLGLGLPKGMRRVDLFVLGCVASIGFTVALFITTVAFSGDMVIDGMNVQDAAKMGALMSFGGAIISVLAGLILRVERKPA